MNAQDCSNTSAKFGAITRRLAREPERNVSRMFLDKAAIVLAGSGRGFCVSCVSLCVRISLFRK